jgi:hypothetical protein
MDSPGALLGWAVVTILDKRLGDATVMAAAWLGGNGTPTGYKTCVMRSEIVLCF